MSYGVRVLARPEIGAGFALAGLETIDAGTAQEGRARLDDMLSEPELGVVLIEEQVYDRLSEETRHKLGRRPLPMVVPFPEPIWAPGAARPEEYIVELLRQVIGYRVRIR
jgi:vacuolar-type H+-ATPase subunit F/Vma7